MSTLTTFQKQQAILQLVNNWVMQGYREAGDAQAALAAQRVQVEWQQHRERDDMFGGGWEHTITTEAQDKRVTEAERELDRRQQVQTFAIEQFLRDKEDE